jgi:hypothetical protein
MQQYRKNIYRTSSGVGSRLIHLTSAELTSDSACAEMSYPSARYIEEDTPLPIPLGTVIYTDAALEIPLTNALNNLHYKCQEVVELPSDLNIIRLTTTGVVTLVSTCSGGGGETFFSYRRDGSQVPENPDFHTPTVDYLDLSGNPQTFFADPNSDTCGSFYALEIVNVNYCIPC